MAENPIINTLTRTEAGQISIERLNQRFKEALAPEIGKLPTLNESDIKKLQYSVVQAHLEQDGFKAYQVFTLEKKRPSEVFEQLKRLDPQISFLAKPSRVDWSISYGMNEDVLSIRFMKFMKIEKKFSSTSEDSEEGIQPVSEVRQVDAFFLADVSIAPLGEKSVVIFSFPKFRKKPTQLYSFKEEGLYIANWLSESLSLKLIPVQLKKFFESFKADSKYDKAGFTVSGLNQKGEDLFPVELQFRSSQRGLSNAYDNLDQIFGPILSETFYEAFEAYSEDHKIANKEAVLEIAKAFFTKYQFSTQDFFDLLHQACEYGIGSIKFDELGKTFRFNLDYSKDVTGLIRVSHLGRAAFDKILKHIKTFINE